MRFFSFRKFPDSSYDCNDNEEFVIHFSSNEQSYLVLYDIKLPTDHSFAICRIKVIKNTKTGQLIFFFLKSLKFFFLPLLRLILHLDMTAGERQWQGRAQKLLLTVVVSHMQKMVIFHSNVDLKDLHTHRKKYTKV